MPRARACGRAAHVPAAVPRAAPASDHTRPCQFLALDIRRAARGNAGEISETLLAGKPHGGGADCRGAAEEIETFQAVRASGRAGTYRLRGLLAAAFLAGAFFGLAAFFAALGAAFFAALGGAFFSLGVAFFTACSFFSCFSRELE